MQLDNDYISAPVAAMDKLIMSQRPTSQKYTSSPATEQPPEPKTPGTDDNLESLSHTEDNQKKSPEDKQNDSKAEVLTETGDQENPEE